MKSGTSYWNISFVIHNLLTFALVIGLQNHFLYTITKTVTVVAVALPQTQAVVGATAALVESLQFNAFDTTRTTFASSPSSSSSWSSPYLPSSSSSFEEAGAVQQKFSSPSLTSAMAYPTPTITTAMTGLHNTKTSRIMGNGNSNSISPTQTINLMHTTFKTRASSSSRSTSSISMGGSNSGSSIGTQLLGKQQNSLSSYPPTTSSGSGFSSAAVLSAFKNVKKSKSTITASNSDTSRSQSSSIYNNDQQQHFPLDFTFSKNHWTNSDAALNGGGVDAGIGGTSSGVVGNFRLASLSSVTSSSSSSSSSSISAFSSSSSSSATETERPRIFRNKHHHERHWGPFFEEPLNSTTSGDNSITTAHLYTEAVLNCRVGMLKDKTVMWVRRTSEKVSLLTVGNVTYSSDPRIRVKFQYPNNWRLLINPTQWDDAGIYMCQVSTHPPRVFTTNLTVIEPPLRLIDDQERDVGDRYYKTGSTIDLQCQVSRSFLYKEKQNILKSLKPLNVHNDSITTSGNSSSSSSTTTTSSSSFRGTSSSSSSSSSGGSASNTLNPGYSNNNNKNQTKMTANKNNNNKHVSPATNINGISSPTSAATTSWLWFF